MVLAFLDTYRQTVTGTDDAKSAVDARAPEARRGAGLGDPGQVRLCRPGRPAGSAHRAAQEGTRRIFGARNRHPAIKPERAQAIRAAVEDYAPRSGRAEFFKTLDVTRSGRRHRQPGARAVHRAGRRRRLVAHESPVRPQGVPPLRHAPVHGPALAVPGCERGRARRPGAADPPGQADGGPRRRERRRDGVPAPRDDPRGEPLQPRSVQQEASEAPGRDRGGRTAHGPGAPPRRGGVTRREHRSRRSPHWATGPALDSVLAGAARFAEHSHIAHRQFRAELRSPGSLPGSWEAVLP